MKNVNYSFERNNDISAVPVVFELVSPDGCSLRHTYIIHNMQVACHMPTTIRNYL